MVLFEHVTLYMLIYCALVLFEPQVIYLDK